ncbi:MAG: undecaprenyl-diphosphate phosphatase [Clostridia bacterium]|nr:undecaprenyl-diphosphate phosphatase [Clostridia bacterium]
MLLLNLLKTLLFGIVEGITEWLPVSSTGHMIILDEIVKLDVSEAFYSCFEVVIQLGAILAVVLLFWKKIWPFGRRDNKEPLSANGVGSYVRKDVIRLWLHILVSCIPAAIVGIAFDDKIDTLFHNYTTVAIMLILFGIAFIAVENYQAAKRRRTKQRPRIRKVADIDYLTAVYIGLFQLIAAIFPGTSRSGATIVGALLIGVSRVAAAEYTFLLAIPVMLGASLLKLLKFGLSFTGMEAAILLVGMATAFVVSLAAIRFLLNYIRKHDFKVFGWYRIALGIVVLLCGFFGLFG